MISNITTNMSSKPIIVTLDDRGPLVNIAAWITMVVMCLTTFVKVGSRLDLTHQLRKDDLFMVMAMVSPNSQLRCVSIHGMATG